MKITIEAVNDTIFENNFFCPDEWDDKSKAAYTEWLAQQPESHPSKSDPTPWNTPREQI